jgi:hypothetical protein
MDDQNDVTDLEETPGIAEMALALQLFQMLKKLKGSDPQRGREWAIAATEAEKLHAWIAYTVTFAFDEE